MERLVRHVQRSLSLTQVILDEIAEGGPMTFARYMELVLYNDPLGYYPATPDATTRHGDFLTAPETHPAFGRLLARFAASEAAALAEPDFTVVEQGAGTGSLAESFIAGWAEEAGGCALRYAIVEPSPGARDRLRSRLGSAVDIVSCIDEVAPFPGLYLSNELPDAFPVHRVLRRWGALMEVFVAAENGTLLEQEGQPSTEDLALWLEDAGVSLAEGCGIEVNLGLEPWLRSVAGALRRGTVITIDYGYEAADAVRFPRGTLLAHYRHASNEEFFERIGRQDLTAHVCWTAIRRIGERMGLAAREQTSQREFLCRWGWKEIGRSLLASGSATHAELDAFDRLGRLDDGLGGLGVLVQVKSP